jgi:exopolysaccharide biosynthesis protein
VSKLVALLLSALVVSAQPASSVTWQPVAPGVEYAHIVRDQPWSIHVLRIDSSQVLLDVFHARDNAVGLERVSELAARRNAIAAINGGYFRMTGTFAGDSTGTLQIDGKILSEPDRGRAAVGLVRTRQGTRLIMGHVAWQGSVKAGDTTRRLDGLNRPRGANELVLFTPEFNDTTLTDGTGTEALIRDGRVVEIRADAGSTAIPRDGFVLSATGTAAVWLRTTLDAGTRVTAEVGLEPVDDLPRNPWRDAEDILGAGPKIVTAGRVDITGEREKVAPAFVTDRHPRSAIASIADGRVLLLVVDGRQPELSVGMSLDELARVLIELGAMDAINLDGGGSTTMVVKDKILNHPSDPTGERPVSDAILVRPRP